MSKPELTANVCVGEQASAAGGQVGILPGMLKHLLNARKQAKASMKNAATVLVGRLTARHS